MYHAHIVYADDESIREYVRRIPEYVGYGVADLVALEVQQLVLAEDAEGQPSVARISIRNRDRWQSTIVAFTRDNPTRRINITAGCECHKADGLDVHHNLLVDERDVRGDLRSRLHE